MKKNYCKIHVANIIEEGRVGGPQIRLVRVAFAIKKKIKTTLIIPKDNSKEFQDYCKSLKIKYFLLPFTILNYNLITIIKYLILFPFEVILLSRILKKNRFDLVHVSGGSWQFKGILAARLARIKVVWELNDTYTPIVIRFIFFFLSFFADNFIFASYSTQSYYEKFILLKKKCFLIQSPVDTNFFDPNVKYPEDDYLKKIKQKIIIGTVANVNPTKNLLGFLKVAKKLTAYSNKIAFIVVGSVYESQHSYYKFLINKIKTLDVKNFFFVGPRKDVRPLLKAFDIYVCSSKNESSPLSVWEAMSMRKPIISTDVGDVGSFVIEGINGYIVKVNDEDALARSIKKLVNKPKLRIKFGKISREAAKNKLNLKICARLHVYAYQSIVNY
jgi:glycosyltransferase involved in cell wall biosynthesis